MSISLASPVTGEILEVNPAKISLLESINQDPFGAGWLALVKVAEWGAD